mmetsp:Transcript_15854/g.32100  ORF Transcript_15854/g.32100 Transcript_15854/m.32100 type:complete len:381 (+) Transcript_15854:277-1419(+)
MRCNARSLILFIVTATFSSFVTWNLSIRHAVLQNSLLEAHSTSVPPVTHNENINHPADTLKFIAVSGLFHTGTTAMWNAIRANEDVAASNGVTLKAYAKTDNGGYPPCGVPLKLDSSVDMKKVMGNSSGIDDSNPLLFAEWGTTWGDWHKSGPWSLPGLMKMPAPHEQEVFYTLWKHTPPQHPMLACSRPDTLYVVMVRHPKIWEESMRKKPYDFKYEPQLKQWRLVRSDPRRLPPLEIRFRSLFNAWEYYTNGYLAWEKVSTGRNCYDGNSTQLTYDDNSKRGNCLGGNNSINPSNRNVIIIRHEDFVQDPKEIVGQIFSFASRGLLLSSKVYNELNFPEVGALNETRRLQVEVTLLLLLIIVLHSSSLIFSCNKILRD